MHRDVILKVKQLRKQYRQPGWWRPSRKPGCVALDGVNLSLERGTTVAIVGHSGAGKSTLARCIAGMELPDSGEIWFEGQRQFACGSDHGRVQTTRMKTGINTRIHMIFQDPGASLNPRFTAFDIVEEAVRFLPRFRREDRREAVNELMELTGLPSRWSNRKSWEFSGGQRARLAIARALAWGPSLLILDESLSSLDLSVRSQIINLLFELQQSRGLTYLVITHDRQFASQIAGQVVVLDRGRVFANSDTVHDLAYEPVTI